MNADREAHTTYLRTVILLVTVFVSGGAIMVYEFIAVRILQRFYGGSVDVWAAEIAVCLAGLAVGYSLGGRLADRRHSRFLLGIAIVAGGALGFLIEQFAIFADNMLLKVDFALSWHPLFAASFSTFLPILALGTIMPQAIKLHAHSLDTIGAVSGRVATVSTVGSIAGVLLTSMVLLPVWGVREILYGLSSILIVFGAGVAWWGKRLAALVFLALMVAPSSASAQILYETYSAYHHILVRDSGDTRVLLFDDDRQSLMSVSDPYRGGFEYADFFHMPLVFDPTIDRVLFIGLGGGTGPKSYFKHYPKMRVDVVEIDPEVHKVAQKYFALPKDRRLHVYLSDGRAYLRRAQGKYGAIMMDAYQSGPNGMYLPYHMATREFFQLVWDKLDNGGSMFYNAVGAYGGMQDSVIRNVHATLGSVFSAVYVFGARSSINTVFIAVKLDPNDLHENGSRDGEFWPQGPWLTHYQSARQMQSLIRRMPKPFHDAVPNMSARVTQFSAAHSRARTGTVLTDNFAPVDVKVPRRRR